MGFASGPGKDRCFMPVLLSLVLLYFADQFPEAIIYSGWCLAQIESVFITAAAVHPVKAPGQLPADQL